MDEARKDTKPTNDVTLRSHIGLNAVNFFLAEVAGVILPFLSTYLRQHGWDYDTIGITIAIGGLGTFLMQIPAGILSDRIKKRRLLLSSTSIILGASYALLPLFVGSMIGISALLFTSSVASAFFVPLLATLALSLVGHKKFDHTMGVNQGWNHAGNIVAALLALLLVKFAGIVSIFYVMGLVSTCAAASILLIRNDELNPDLSKEKDAKTEKSYPPASVKKNNVQGVMAQTKDLLRDKSIRMLVICVALFHIANAPVMPLVGLYLKHLGGGNWQVAMVVLVAQVVMIPVALLTGKFCSSRGRKPIFAIAFLVLPLRIFLYALTTNPNYLLGIQALDGIGAGIYGVVIALMCSDLTKGKSGFNTLLGIMQTALALGGIIGPLAQGFLTQQLGFTVTFIGLALVACVGAALFLLTVPETKNYKTKNDTEVGNVTV
ncbi:MAG: MFS transporter [Candidatus Nitrosopolaris sp.]|jgi:MFS family permease